MVIDSPSTREQIKKMYLNLSERKNYVPVSVAELCRELNMNRATFYYYFESIDTLLNEIEFDFLNKIAFAECFTGNIYIYEEVLKHTKYVQQNRSTLFILLANGKLTRKFEEMGLERSSAFSRRRFSSYNQDGIALLTAYTIAGHISLLKSWLTNCPDTPAEQIATIICEMAFAAGNIQKNDYNRLP